jgi:hypothetical protein
MMYREQSPIYDELMDDRIDQWHESHEDDVPLHAFLGMSWETYSRWAQDRNAPRV